MVSSTSPYFKKVARHIARVASEMGVQAKVYRSVTSVVDLKIRGQSAVIVQRADPVTAVPYMLMLRNCTKYGVQCVYYATAEGWLDTKHVYAWMMEGRYVAVSSYVKEKLEESGIPVEDVVHYGIDMEEVKYVRKNIHLGEKYMLDSGIDPSKYIVVTAVTDSLPSRGLWWLAKTAKYVAKLDTEIKFLVVTDERGLEYFGGLDNVVAKPDFGGLDETLELAVIASSHIYVEPALAEGFGLAILEAMALGVPVVHADLPPTREFSVGWRVSVVDVVKFTQKRPYHSGIIYEHHLYRVEDFAKTIVEVAEMVRNGDEAIKQYRQKATEKVAELDIRNVYSKLIRKVV